MLTATCTEIRAPPHPGSNDAGQQKADQRDAPNDKDQQEEPADEKVYREFDYEKVYWLKNTAWLISCSH